ncbi:MAG: hypothetical protein ACXWGS_13425, partial [Solirubrobacterales bacterium]
MAVALHTQGAARHGTVRNRAVAAISLTRAMLKWDQDVRPVLLAIHQAIESHPSDHVASKYLGPLTDSAGINT